MFGKGEECCTGIMPVRINASNNEIVERGIGDDILDNFIDPNVLGLRLPHNRQSMGFALR
jgi:hypothetical protein